MECAADLGALAVRKAASVEVIEKDAAARTKMKTTIAADIHLKVGVVMTMNKALAVLLLDGAATMKVPADLADLVVRADNAAVVAAWAAKCGAVVRTRWTAS